MGFEFVKEFVHEFEEGGEVGLVGGSFETEVDEVALLTQEILKYDFSRFEGA